MFAAFHERVEMKGKSGRGLPHSKTLTRLLEGSNQRQLLDCGDGVFVVAAFGCAKPTHSGDFADSPPHSKTLTRYTAPLEIPPGLGVRQSSGALGVSRLIATNPAAKPRSMHSVGQFLLAGLFLIL